MEISNNDTSYLLRKQRQLRDSLYRFKCTADTCAVCSKVDECNAVIDNYVEIQRINAVLDKLYKK